MNNSVILLLIVISIGVGFLFSMLFDGVRPNMALFQCLRIEKNNDTDKNVVNSTIKIVEKDGIENGNGMKFRNTRYNFIRPPQSVVDSILKNLSTINESDYEKIFFDKAHSIVAGKHYLITAVPNNGFFELVLNWIAAIKMNNYTEFFIACTDKELYINLIRYGFYDHVAMIPLSWIQNPLSTQDVGKKGGQEYNLVTQTKLIVVQRLLVKDFTVFLSDVDVIWLSPNILKYVDFAAKNKELIFSTDINGAQNGDGMNSGFYCVRPTATSKKVFTAMMDELKSGRPDQLIANDVFNKMNFLGKNTYPLDPILFPHGLTYYHQKRNEELNVVPMIMHACWLGGVIEKKKALEESGMWYL